MKTFKELCIGDVLYIIKNDYTAKEGPQLKQEIVINIGKKSQYLEINKTAGYHNDYYTLRVLFNFAKDLDWIEYEKQYITTNIEKVDDCLKQVGLNIIKEYEQDIELSKDKIKETCKLYFQYLNKH